MHEQSKAFRSNSSVTKQESWVLLFRIVVLEKTFESPLDHKEVKSVNSKGNQPWILIEMTDAEAEVPII